MGQVNTMIGNLRNMAIDMGSEISNQNSQISRINQKVRRRWLAQDRPHHTGNHFTFLFPSGHLKRLAYHRSESKSRKASPHLNGDVKIHSKRSAGSGRRVCASSAPGIVVGLLDSLVEYCTVLMLSGSYGRLERPAFSTLGDFELDL